jgi:hypothetical protein
MCVRSSRHKNAGGCTQGFRHVVGDVLRDIFIETCIGCCWIALGLSQDESQQIFLLNPDRDTIPLSHIFIGYCTVLHPIESKGTA